MAGGASATVSADLAVVASCPSPSHPCRLLDSLRHAARQVITNELPLMPHWSSLILTSPHFSPGAVMIAEDFGPVYTRGQKTREGAASAVRHRHDHRHRGQTSETQELFDADKRPGEKCGLSFHAVLRILMRESSRSSVQNDWLSKRVSSSASMPEPIEWLIARRAGPPGRRHDFRHKREAVANELPLLLLDQRLQRHPPPTLTRHHLSV